MNTIVGSSPPTSGRLSALRSARRRLHETRIPDEQTSKPREPACDFQRVQAASLMWHSEPQAVQLFQWIRGKGAALPSQQHMERGIQMMTVLERT